MCFARGGPDLNQAVFPCGLLYQAELPPPRKLVYSVLCAGQFRIGFRLVWESTLGAYIAYSPHCTAAQTLIIACFARRYFVIDALHCAVQDQ